MEAKATAKYIAEFNKLNKHSSKGETYNTLEVT